MKRWSFRIASKEILPSDRAWIRIGQQPIPMRHSVAKASAATEAEVGQATAGDVVDWEIDLPLVLKSQILRIIGVVATVGVLVAAPTVLSVLQQPPLTLRLKI